MDPTNNSPILKGECNNDDLYCDIISFPENRCKHYDTDLMNIQCSTDLSIVYFNACSIVAHFDDIVLFLD